MKMVSGCVCCGENRVYFLTFVKNNLVLFLFPLFSRGVKYILLFFNFSKMETDQYMQNDINIKHHGGITGVTGSCHELCIDEFNSVLIDCGLFQGAETSAKGASFNKLEIDFNIDNVSALLVTHCHIDHVGRITYLLAAGFKGKIYCSIPTARLLPKVLEDAVKVGFTTNRNMIQRFIKVLKDQIVAIPYKEWFDIPLKRINEDTVTGKLEETCLSVKFKKAGHILGSSYIECRVRKSSESKKIVFSGDLGASYSPLLSAPKSPYSTDILVIEGTYGDRIHENRRIRRNLLQKILIESFKDNGIILIPAFSIGRTQELLYELEQIIYQPSINKPIKVNSADVEWKDVDVIVDSPLASRFTETYQELKEFWDKEAHKKVLSGRHPLSFDQIITIDSHKEHLSAIKSLKKTKQLSIVIAASGMCAGGRIVNYLKSFISNPKTDILFAGYQAEGTSGYIIQRYGKSNGYVELDGDRYTIRAGVHILNGYSAHADQQMLINFVKRMRKKPSEIRIVHGSIKAKTVLKKEFKRLFSDIKITIPS